MGKDEDRELRANGYSHKMIRRFRIARILKEAYMILQKKRLPEKNKKSQKIKRNIYIPPIIDKHKNE